MSGGVYGGGKDSDSHMLTFYCQNVLNVRKLWPLPFCLSEVSDNWLIVNNARWLHTKHLTLWFTSILVIRSMISPKYPCKFSTRSNQWVVWCLSRGVSLIRGDNPGYPSSVTVKITGPRTVAGKTHVGLVNFLYTIMLKIRKIKPNSGSVRQKPKSFLGDCILVAKIWRGACWNSASSPGLIYHAGWSRSGLSQTDIPTKFCQSACFKYDVNHIVCLQGSNSTFSVCIPVEDRAYFGDGDGVNSNPGLVCPDQSYDPLT